MEEKSKVEQKAKPKMIRATIRIEEEKLKKLEEITKKQNPIKKNTTTNSIITAIDFYVNQNENVEKNNEIEKINDEIKSIKNQIEEEKINSFDCDFLKNIQKNFTLTFNEEEIFYIIKNIFNDEISKIKNKNLQENRKQIKFILLNEEEFFLKMKIFIMKNLTKRHQLKPYLYQIFYEKIYKNLPSDKEDINKFYNEYVKDIILLDKKFKIALRKLIFEEDKNFENLKITLNEFSQKISKIEKYADELLFVLGKCNEKK